MTTAYLPLDDLDIPFAELVAPAPQPAIPDSPPQALGLVELILKNRPLLERMIREPRLHARLLSGLLSVALIGFTLFGTAMIFVLHAAKVWPTLTPIATVLNHNGGAEFSGVLQFTPGVVTPMRGCALVVAYTFGLIAASGVCLPSLYFYGLLAGIRLTMLDVVMHTLKAKATAAVALVGLTPIYLTLAMGAVILGFRGSALNAVLWLGLVLPFIAGLWGTWSLYRGFLLAAGAECRICFLRRLVLAWCACYSAVTPVMIFTVWRLLQPVL